MLPRVASVVELVDRLEKRNYIERHRDQADRRGGDRFQDQSENGGSEQGKVEPGVRLQPGRRGDEGNDDPHGDHDQGLDRVIFRGAFQTFGYLVYRSATQQERFGMIYT